MSFRHYTCKSLPILALWVLTWTLNAQVAVVLDMQQKLAELPFAYDQITEAEPGYFFNVSRLQYYVSEITLVHDGGQRTLVEDLFLLIDPAKDSLFDLGSYDISDLEQLEFWIGVDSAHNHLDPSTYPENHPLAHHDPSMHWGWAGGYRFLVIEGVAGYTPGFLSGAYQIHSIGDENYRKISLVTDEYLASDTMVIPVEADYSKLLRRVNIAGGWESHSSVGKSKQVLINTQHVFSGVLLSSTEESEYSTSIQIIPNPVNDFFYISADSQMMYPLQIYLLNQEGKALLQRTVYFPGEKVNLNRSLSCGLYFLSITDSQHHIATTKIIVQE